uniref:serine-type D-Ala-D-Ala carboxypeptidase n=1 Tax=Candidatus Kentrum sp. SD TaxID=2126332 RepID=A0A451BQ57_9GAMM|nr:MAG: D-alanyl-D-alanine carboxypeptidase (penicillin-binding protein 5/6) [Candidatus Kentron sp. SD]VFK48489.1 MAG: D-alanyl-D-alanine carboxypeptidase (penicillin-binding protein 5/6) [Candidatus Kentron sp. SD]VFK80432.1 MAG: D-alanyl-D-alanine carboxypeptidase (penicillin-binding protein 5/6) [Candidatus Kentron sp. SD]
MHPYYSLPFPFSGIKTLFVSVLLFSTIASFSSSAAAARISRVPSPPGINAKGYILIDAYSGRVLAEKDPDARVEPASLTKMMTSYVIFTELRAGNITLDEEVLISEKAWRTSGSRTYVEVGNRVPVRVLLKGVIIQSGNDASVALAEHIAGNELAFAQRMNQQAKHLGLKNSHFTNASGLPNANHYTTTRDMALLGIALARDFPELYKIHSIKSHEYNNIKQYNRNKLLWRDETVDGIKTGYTEAAGYCLVASAHSDGMRLVSVVMGSKNVKSRTKATQALLNYGFRFFKTRRLYEGRVPLTTVRIWKGDIDQLEVGLMEPIYLTAPTQQFDKLEANIEFNTKIIAPVEAGDVQGKLRIMLDGKTLLMEKPLVSLRSVPKGGLWRRLSDGIKMYFD